MRPLFALLIAVSFGAGENDGSGRQMTPVWTPEPGWQLVQEHPVDPDLVVVGIFGERWIDPETQPTPPRTSGFPSGRTNKKRDRRIDTANMPRLVLTCENGVTSAVIMRPTEAFPDSGYRTRVRDPRRNSAEAMDGDGVITLVFDDGERVDIDLRDTPHRIDPVYLPDPFDTIGRMLRQETLYYFEITRGKAVYIPFSGDAWGSYPDAVFHLEGLGELLDSTRDPCGWGAD